MPGGSAIGRHLSYAAPHPGHTLAALGLGMRDGGTVDAKMKNEQKIRFCHRTSATDVGVTKRREKSRAKKELKRHAFDTRGRCSAAPAPGPQGPQCTNNNDCTGGLVCITQTCQACTDTRQCSGNQVCLNGTCQTPGPSPGPVCPALCPPC